MALTRFTLRQIETLSLVAELKSFIDAAERLGLTASAVSQLIAELESVLDLRLLERTTRRVDLSSAGAVFLASAETILRHVQQAESVASDLRNRAAGIVRIGAPQVLAAYALPLAMRDYAQSHPKVVVRIRDTPVEHLVERVASGDLDLALGPDRVTGNTVAREGVFLSPWVLWCRPEHPLAQRKSVRWKDLYSVPLVAAGRDHERSVEQMALNVPASSRITPVDVVDSISTALGIAAQGQAVTLAPAYVEVMAKPLGLVMRRVTAPETIRHVSLYQSTARPLSPAAEGFAAFLVGWLQQWPGRSAMPGAARAP